MSGLPQENQMHSYQVPIIMLLYTKDFDLENFEHVIILGKVIKLCEKFIDPENEWLQSL
jgi:hypothetical protein